MTQQKSLFDDDVSQGSQTTPVAVVGSAHTLTREQKQFNRLIAQIAAARADLDVWQAMAPDFQRRSATEVHPLLAQLREKRRAIVAVLDAAMDGRKLTKPERRKVADLLRHKLSELLQEAEEPALVRLYDKYSTTSYEDAQQDSADLMQQVASEIFGVKFTREELAGSSDEVAGHISEKLMAEENERAARRVAKPGKKSSKAAAAEVAREQAAQGASKSVREVYRKLASELHPDRETDPAERARKTTLMQQVNQAYESGDLLTLLELQLQIEQINPAHLASMARERLLHFNVVLTEQLQRLREELDVYLAPFLITGSGFSRRDISPDLVNAGLSEEIHELQRQLHALDDDLRDYQELSTLKLRLKRYKVGAAELDDFELLDQMLMMGVPPMGGRRRRR